MLFRKHQNIFYVGVLNVLSLHWEVRLRPLSSCLVEISSLNLAPLGSPKAPIIFCASTLTGHSLCALWPESLFGLHGWHSPCCRWGVPPCFSVRQTKPVLKNVNEVQELRVLNLGSVSYSPDTSCQPWYGTYATIGRILRRCQQIIAPCFFNMQSYWSASCRVQLSSVHEWSPWMSFGSWKVIHGVFCSF